MMQKKSSSHEVGRRTYSSRILKSPRVVDDALVIDRAASGSMGASRSHSSISGRLLSVEAMLKEAKERAEKVIEEARIEAQRLEDEANARIHRAIEKAKEEGYQEGLRRGFAAAEIKIVPVLETITNITERAGVERAQLINDSEESLIALAIEVARKIIGEEVSVNPDMVAKTVEKAIQKVDSEGPIRIRLNPEDLAVLAPYWDKITGPGDMPIKWETVADEKVGRGGCIIDTRYGAIDAQIDTQLWKIGRTLVDIA